MRRLFLAAVLTLSATTLAPLCRAEESPESRDLTALSLEDLLTNEVTSVAKRPQRVDEAAAAVFVITREDIERSGATSLPELFRMVPGMEVADLPANGAAVTARGANGRFSNKLLVLIDGRAVYLSTLSGVLWDQQLTPVEDIQRIEIVRGPGATLWGANAVNGVINIVTRHAADALGVAFTGRVDDRGGERAYGRYGAKIGANGALRLHVSAGNAENTSVSAAPVESWTDTWQSAQAGFRYDADPSDIDSITLQGDIQTGEFDIAPVIASPMPQPFPMRGEFQGVNILGRWTRSTGAASGYSLQIYWDRVERSEIGLDGRRDQIDLDFSQHFRLGDRHNVVFGAGYRWTEDEVAHTGLARLDPSSRTDSWYGLYLQDDISVVPDRLNVSIGAKVEHNRYTGVEIQPSVRAIWTDPRGWSAWVAVSRAVRTPSRLETGLAIDNPFVAIEPAGTLQAEELIAYEAGWRGRLSSSVRLDLTAYHQAYENLVTWSVRPAMGPGQPFLTYRYVNGGSATAAGLEAALDARLTSRWTVKAAATAMDLDATFSPLADPFFGGSLEGASPRSQLSIRSWFNVRDNLDLDIWYRHVASLKDGPIPAYDDLDIRVAWRPTANLEIFLRGANLLEESRREMAGNPGAIVSRRFEVGLSAKY